MFKIYKYDNITFGMSIEQAKLILYIRIKINR